jgi:hypothetical protein
MAVINYLVEGEIDEVVAVHIITKLGHEVGAGFGKKGSSYIKHKIGKFNLTAKNICYLTLIDFMDTGCECPAEVIIKWLPNRNDLMLFRVVVKEIESWLLADRKNIAKFLNVNIERIPLDPEAELDPKRQLVNIARGSRSSKIRLALVPGQNSTAQVGKLYTSEIKKFVNEFWDINTARENSPSLDKCLLRLQEIKNKSLN